MTDAVWSQRILFRGRERVSFEVEGAVDAERAARLVGSRVSILPDAEGQATVGLLVFRCEGLKVRGVPGPGLNYGEALWRLKVMHEGAPAWAVVRCDLDNPLVVMGDSVLVRYPVCRSRFAFREDDGRFEVTVRSPHDSLLMRARPIEEGRDEEGVIPILVPRGPRLYRVPWGDTLAPVAVAARFTIEEDVSRALFGEAIRWRDRGRALRGRTHACGIARQV